MTETEIRSALEKLYVAVVCDVLDSLGYPNQALPSHIRPTTPHFKLSGRAFTATAKPVDAVPAEPYKLEIEAVDRMTSGDVFVVECGEDRTCGFWGELLTTACVYKGVRGVVMNASTRDVWKIKEIEFPVFGIGVHPADSKGRMDITELAQPIELGGVTVAPGDWILGDEDGLVCIPQGIASKAIELALEKISGENIARADLAAGVPMGEVFQRYGIL